MQYFVIGIDGQSYGPADLPTLEQWALQGRVLPNMQLIEAQTGRQVAARSILPSFMTGQFASPTVAPSPTPGANFGVTHGTPGVYSQPYRPNYPPQTSGFNAYPRASGAPLKSPQTAGILSLVIPGAGQIYNGQLLKGVVTLLAGIVLGIVCCFAGIPLAFWAMSDASKIANRINRGEFVGPWTT